MASVAFSTCLIVKPWCHIISSEGWSGQAAHLLAVDSLLPQLREAVGHLLVDLIVDLVMHARQALCIAPHLLRLHERQLQGPFTQGSLTLACSKGLLAASALAIHTGVPHLGMLKGAACSLSTAGLSCEVMQTALSHSRGGQWCTVVDNDTSWEHLPEDLPCQS